MRQPRLTVCGTATLEQVNKLMDLGVPRFKAIDYSREYATKRIGQLISKNGPAVNRSRTKSGGQQNSTAKLLTGPKLWPRITSLIAKQPGECLVAVAFVGGNVADILPVSKGSVLVVNMGRSAVELGLTNPYEVGRLLRRGVEIHTAENLHAKVFVFSDRAIVGSMNSRVPLLACPNPVRHEDWRGAADVAELGNGFGQGSGGQGEDGLRRSERAA